MKIKLNTKSNFSPEYEEYRKSFYEELLKHSKKNLAKHIAIQHTNSLIDAKKEFNAAILELSTRQQQMDIQSLIPYTGDNHSIFGLNL